MRKLMDVADFKELAIKEMPFDSFYISALSEELGTGKKNWGKAFINGLKSNVDGYKNKNTSSLIYVFQPLD